MGYFFNALEGKKTAAPLKGVHGSKNIANKLFVFGSFFKLNKRLIELIKNFFSLQQKLF